MYSVLTQRYYRDVDGIRGMKGLERYVTYLVSRMAYFYYVEIQRQGSVGMCS